MSAPKPVHIVGGGLAGLALGIGLRQRGVPVTIHEAGNYPRHRVCGEFISGRGQATLARLGLSELFDRAGAVSAANDGIFLGDPVNSATTIAVAGHLSFTIHARRHARQKIPRTRR